MERSPLIPNAISDDPRIHRLLISAAALTVAGDFLFWAAQPGMSIGIFVILACCALALNRPAIAFGRNAAVAGALLAAAAVQTLIQLSFSNVVAIASLLLVLVGETSFPHLRRGWARWAEAARAFIIAPTSWRWVRSTLQQVRLDPKSAGRYAGIFIRVILPALALGGLFTVLLGFGNAIFARWLTEAWENTWAALPGIDFTFGRVALWLLLTTFALALLCPATSAGSDRLWTRTVPAFAPPRDPAIARWRGVSILAVLNALFFGANTIDAIYLWMHRSLPAGINYSEFVHQGVYSLLAAVLLSALVLTAIFQQADSVVTSRLLRALGLAWLVQNVVLIAGVLLRLKLYVDAYQLSELRVYVGCFLLLVTTGFALLAWRIVRRKGLGWLLFLNLLATFSLFFIVQFLDVAAWVANYNVARWMEDSRRTLDVDYLASLGSSAYPALITAAEAPRPEAHDAFQRLQDLKAFERDRLTNLNWRSWQVREIGYARLLVEKEIRTRRP